MRETLTSLEARLRSGELSAPAVIEQANKVRASALRDFVFNDEHDVRKEAKGRKLVAQAEAIIAAAKRQMEEAEQIAADLALCVEEGGTLDDYIQSVLDEWHYSNDTDEPRPTAAKILDHLLALRVITPEQAQAMEAL